MKITDSDSLKTSVASFLSISLYFFQLFDHVAEAEVILRNTGRLGFKFSIIDPQREEKADEEEGEQRKVLEDAEQQPYVQQQDENGLEVTPGRPRVVPDAVSSSWDYFRRGRVIDYVKDIFYQFVCVCVLGLH